MVIPEKYNADIQRLRLALYQPSTDSDLLLLHWWMQLHESSDIKEVFHKQNYGFSKFIQLFQQPTLFFYSLSASNRINFAIWFTSCDMAETAATTALWADRSLRRTDDLLRLGLLTHLAIFTMKKHLFAVTRQKRIQRFAEEGYHVIGQMPGFYEDEIGYILHADYDTFINTDINKRLMQEYDNGIRN